jgi:hypothetical protein
MIATFDRYVHIDDVADLATRARGVLRHSGVRSLGDAAENRGDWRNHPLATAAVITNIEDVLAEHGLLP